MYLIPSSHLGQTPRYRVKVCRETGSYSYQIALAGYKKEDITVRCTDDSILTVSSKRSESVSAYPIAEFFAKPFSLSWCVRGYEVSQAKMEDGVLEVLMAKKEISDEGSIPIL